MIKRCKPSQNYKGQKQLRFGLIIQEFVLLFPVPYMSRVAGGVEMVIMHSWAT